MASKTVDEYPDCERCPNRIFNTGKYIQGGRGSIKCACSNNYNTYLTAIDKCRNILWKELARINYKYLFIFGDAYLSISNNHIPRFMATGGKYIFNNYSPLVKFKDDNLYHMFKQRFADDVNWVTKNRNNYGIV